MSTSAVRVRPRLSPIHTPPLWNAAAAYRVGRVKRVSSLPARAVQRGRRVGPERLPRSLREPRTAAPSPTGASSGTSWLTCKPSIRLNDSREVLETETCGRMFHAVRAGCPSTHDCRHDISQAQGEGEALSIEENEELTFQGYEEIMNEKNLHLLDELLG